MLKKGGQGVASSLLFLFSLSWSQGYLPGAWRQVEIVPVPKTPQARQWGHFRPISLLGTVSKVMEKVVKERLELVAERDGWLSI